MKKIKIILIIIIEIILLDTLQAKIYNESPFIKTTKMFINDYYKEEKGILVNTYTCMNRKRQTLFKWQTPSCSKNDTTLKELYKLQKEIDNYFASHKDYKNISSTGVDELKEVIIIELLVNNEEEKKKVLEMLNYPNYIEFKQGGPYSPM